jgi:hypothetical protein
MTSNENIKIEIGSSGERIALRLTNGPTEEEFSITPEQRSSLLEGPATPIVHELIQTELDKRIKPVSKSERLKKGIGSSALIGTASSLVTYGVTKDITISTFIGIYSGVIGASVVDSEFKDNPFVHNQRLLSRTDTLRKAFRLFPYES